jgi:hypothetical protein
VSGLRLSCWPHIPIAVVVALAISSQGCARHQSLKSEPPLAAADSAVGVIAVTGTSFEERLMLRVDGEWIRLRPDAGDSAALTRLSGVEVLVRGQRLTSGLLVQSFSVLRVDGQRVFDGVIRQDGARLVLETATDRVALGNPPAILRGMIGARVWIGGPLETGPNTYGIIVAPVIPVKCDEVPTCSVRLPALQ